MKSITNKIIIFSLILLTIFCFSTNCFAVASFPSRNDPALVYETPDLPVDVKTAFPGRNYFLIVREGYADLYILNVGCYYKISESSSSYSFDVYDANGNFLGNKNCGTWYYYRSTESNSWSLIESTICRFSAGKSDNFGFMSNVDIKDDKNNVVFPQTLTALAQIQTQAGETVRQGITKNLMVLVPVGLTIFSALLLVFVIASRKWLLM